MEVKEAVRIAKSYLADLYDDEGIINVGLEEVEFDEPSDTWRITLGFSHEKFTKISLVPTMIGDRRLNRSYKVIRVRDDNGKVMSLTDRLLGPSKQ